MNYKRESAHDRPSRPILSSPARGPENMASTSPARTGCSNTPGCQGWCRTGGRVSPGLASSSVVVTHLQRWQDPNKRCCGHTVGFITRNGAGNGGRAGAHTVRPKVRAAVGLDVFSSGATIVAGPCCISLATGYLPTARGAGLGDEYRPFSIPEHGCHTVQSYSTGRRHHNPRHQSNPDGAHEA